MILVILIGAASFGPLFLQDEPILEAATPPTAEDVAATRQLVRDLRAAARGNSGDTLLTVDAAQLNSAIRLGARFIEGFRGQVQIGTEEVWGEISLPVHWWGRQRWLNISGRVPEFERAVALSQIRIGATDLPPKLALALARTGGNIAMGNRFGDKVLQAASAMAVTGDRLTFRIALDAVGTNGVMRSTFGAMRGAEMPSPQEIESYHKMIRRAMEDGTLKPSGSFLPYLHFTLSAALERGDAETLPRTYTAAILGLAMACGAKDFWLIAGRMISAGPKTQATWTTSCREMTLNGRIDSRRHFVTAAAIQAISNTGFAISIGEFKELYDTISGAGGFDFTDMAANLSGIRLSNVLMATPPGAWPGLLARLKNESDVIVAFEGIPVLMPEAEFKARFGNLESRRYKEMLATIEARIDGIGLYQPD